MEMYSPAAIENDPASRPAIPASSVTVREVPDPAKPMTRAVLDTRPSLTRTRRPAARRTGRCGATIRAAGSVPGGPGGPGRAGAPGSGRGCARRRPSPGRRPGRCRTCRRRPLGSLDHRQHGLDRQPARRRANQPGAQARAAGGRYVGACFAQFVFPVRGVLQLDRGQLTEDLLALAGLRVSQPRVQRGGVPLAGEHVRQRLTDFVPLSGLIA